MRLNSTFLRYENPSGSVHFLNVRLDGRFQVQIKFKLSILRNELLNTSMKVHYDQWTGVYNSKKSTLG